MQRLKKKINEIEQRTVLCLVNLCTIQVRSLKGLLLETCYQLRYQTRGEVLSALCAASRHMQRNRRPSSAIILRDTERNSSSTLQSSTLMEEILRNSWRESIGRFCADEFKAVIGVSLAVASTIWSSIPAAALLAAGVEPVHLLWFFAWIRLNEPWYSECTRWHVCEKTFRTKVKAILDLLLIHLDEIDINDRFSTPSFEGLSFAVLDATLCPVHCNRKVWRSQKPYYSPKHGMHGLKYEIAVNWITGRICWVAGGVFGSMSDLTITRYSGLLRLLQPNEFLLADKGYVGEWQILTPFKGTQAALNTQQLYWNLSMNGPRTIVENVFARFHKFRILSSPFRGEHAEHVRLFAVIAQIVQIELAFQPVRRDGLENPSRHAFYKDDWDNVDPPNLAQHMQFLSIGCVNHCFY